MQADPIDDTIDELTNMDQNDTTLEPLDELNLRYANILLPFTFVLGLSGIIGAIGNVFVVLIYGFKKCFRDKKFRTYVILLALLDLVTCLTLIPAEMWKHRSYFNFIETYHCKTKCFLNVFAASTSFYCLLLVGVDRYIITCHPLLPIQCRTFSHKMALRLCVLTVVLGAMTAVPAAVLCGISTGVMTNKFGNHTVVYMCQSEPQYEHSIHRAIYRYTLGVLQTIISVVLLVLYAQIGFAVDKVLTIRRRSYRSRKGCIVISGEHSLESNGPCLEANGMVTTTPMPSNIKLMFAVTFVFIVTYYFYCGLSFVDQRDLSPKQFLAFSIFFRLYLIHSMLNPFLYLKMDRQFRKQCSNLLGFTK